MKGSSLLETLYQLSITPSRSHPRVSNDNPYAESIFRTCKIVLTINFLTPNQWHNGLTDEVFEQRIKVYEEAKSLHPERWSREIRDWSLDEEVWLNPERISQVLNEYKRTSKPIQILEIATTCLTITEPGNEF